MRTFVLYMYRTLGKLNSNNDKYILQFPSTPLVALLESNDPVQPTMQQKVDMYNLRPFELQQNLIDLTIKLASKNNTKILRIEFDFPIDAELEEELIEAIQTDNYNGIIALIDEIRMESSDIKALTFLYNSKQFRVTKYGVVEIDAYFEELSNLALNSPVALLTGLKKTIEG